MTDTARIRWDDTPVGTISGHVGSIEQEAFAIWKPPRASGEWVLESDLPGLNTARCYADDPDALKDEAERWLAGFVSSLGAVFPGGHPGDNAIEAYCATGAGDGDGRHLLQYAVRLSDGTTTAYGDQSWVKGGLGSWADGASTVVRDIWVSYGPWRTHETTAATTAREKD